MKNTIKILDTLFVNYSIKGTKIEIKLYDFCHASFFENALLDSQNLAKKIQNPKNFTPSHYNQKTVFDSIT